MTINHPDGDYYDSSLPIGANLEELGILTTYDEAEELTEDLND